MRPQAISILCVLGVMGAIFGAGLAVMGDGYTLDLRVWLLILAGVQLKAMQGIWNMKKWGVTLYAVKLVVVQLSWMFAGYWNVLDMLVPVLMMLALSKYYSDMR